MTKPYLLAIGDFYEWDLVALSEDFELVALDDATAPAEISGDIRQKTLYAARIFHRDVGAELFDAFPNLKIVANYGVGYDGIDTDEAAERGIAVTNTPDVLTDDVADQAVLLLLTFLRNSHAAEKFTRDGLWAKGDFPLQQSLRGGRVGIAGLGRIGSAVARRLSAFGCSISYFARAPKETPEDWMYRDTILDLAREVRFLINVLPGGPDTEDLFDAAVFDALGPQGVFVNIGRGSSVDEDALIAALMGGVIAGAALDVFKREPNIDLRFLELENVVLQPHAASATVETRRAMGALMRENLVAALNGAALLTRVN